MRAFKIILCVLLALLIACGVIYFFCDDVMADLYLSLGDRADAKGDTETALAWYEKAFDRDISNYETCHLAGLGYAQAGNFTKAEKILYYGINASPDCTDLYLCLSSVYAMQDKLLDAATLLDSITDPTARAGVDAVRPNAPVLSYEDGEYNEYITVGISYDDTAACFYDDTGDYPSINGTAYTGGITLPEGTTVIRAVAVNENGIVSSMVEGTYTVANVVEQVTFIDPVIDKVVRTTLSKNDSAEILSSELWDMEQLKITHWDGQITDYSDLHWFKKIPSLVLEGQESIDYDALMVFNDLKTLWLKNCSVTTADLEKIAAIGSLETLNLTDNSIASLAYLVDMPNLRELIIPENSLSDLTVISGMTTLEKLDLRENAIENIDAVSSLRKLKYLDLEDNIVSDLSPLDGSQLTYLNVTRCPVGDITSVGSILTLETFKADYCEIFDISALSTCTKLTDLSMKNNQITDISSLLKLESLQTLDLSENFISSSTSMAGMTALRELRLSYNTFSNVTAFVGMPSLELLDIEHNTVTSVEALKDCPKLQKLYCFGNAVEDSGKLENITVYG